MCGLSDPINNPSNVEENSMANMMGNAREVFWDALINVQTKQDKYIINPIKPKFSHMERNELCTPP